MTPGTRRVARSLVPSTALAAGLLAAIVWALQGSAAPAPPGGPPAADGVREIAVRAHAWGFSPSVIRVRPGETVRFTVSTDDIMHGLAIDALGVRLALRAGQEARSAAVTVALAQGVYPLHCTAFCGLGHSAMKGRLVVGDPGPGPARRAPWAASLAALGLTAASLIGAWRAVRPRP